jgi:hypothetical protein
MTLRIAVPLTHLDGGRQDGWAHSGIGSHCGGALDRSEYCAEVLEAYCRRLFVYSVCCLSAERRGCQCTIARQTRSGRIGSACRQRHARNVPRARRSLSAWLLPVVVAWCMPRAVPDTSSALYAARCAARYTTHCTRPLTHCRLNGRSPRRCCIGSARVCNKIGVINRAMAEDFDGEVHAVHHIQRTPSAGHGRIDAAASLTVAIPSHSAFAHAPQ